MKIRETFFSFVVVVVVGKLILYFILVSNRAIHIQRVAEEKKETQTRKMEMVLCEMRKVNAS